MKLICADGQIYDVMVFENIPVKHNLPSGRNAHLYRRYRSVEEVDQGEGSEEESWQENDGEFEEELL